MWSSSELQTILNKTSQITGRAEKQQETQFHWNVKVLYITTTKNKNNKKSYLRSIFVMHVIDSKYK